MAQKAKQRTAHASRLRGIHLSVGAASLGMILSVAARYMWRASREVDGATRAPFVINVLSTLSERMAAESPVESACRPACEAASHLWGSDMSCRDFLATHWESWPKLSRPGSAWTRALFSASDVAWMLQQWPVRYHTKHGTAQLLRPGSGFLNDPRPQRGSPVPVDVLHGAMRDGLTFVCHNLEVLHPSVARLVRDVAAFFHAYTQVNLYFSPPGLEIATAPHQDAHSVFIIQIHGSKRWSVHAPTHGNLTLKALQRGKRGEVLLPSDGRFMTPPVLTATLTPGDVLYIPRAFYHQTSTIPQGEPGAASGEQASDAAGEQASDIPAQESLFGAGAQPSLALTVAITTEDVFSTWLHLLGEAVQALAQRPGAPVELAHGAAQRLVGALRRLAAAEPGGELGAMLREALPRALMARANVLPDPAQFEPRDTAMAEGGSRAALPADSAKASLPTFATGGPVGAWRLHAQSLLLDAMAADGLRAPRWLTGTGGSGSPGAAQREALFLELDAVLLRKRVSCQLKLEQIDRFLREVGEARLRADVGGGSLDGELRQIDLDGVFAIEKRSKDYVPTDRSWHRVAEWGGAGSGGAASGA